MESGYNKKMMRKQISGAREHSRNDLLETEKPQIWAWAWAKPYIQHYLLSSFSKC